MSEYNIYLSNPITAFTLLATSLYNTISEGHSLSKFEAITSTQVNAHNMGVSAQNALKYTSPMQLNAFKVLNANVITYDKNGVKTFTDPMYMNEYPYSKLETLNNDYNIEELALKVEYDTQLKALLMTEFTVDNALKVKDVYAVTAAQLGVKDSNIAILFSNRCQTEALTSFVYGESGWPYSYARKDSFDDISNDGVIAEILAIRPATSNEKGAYSITLSAIREIYCKQEGFNLVGETAEESSVSS